MGLPDDSWHIRYYEYSYFYYIAFALVIASIYAIFYCIKVPTRKFTNLQHILENDPIINSFRFNSPITEDQKFIAGQTMVPEHNYTENRMKLRKEQASNSSSNILNVNQSQNLRQRQRKSKEMIQFYRTRSTELTKSRSNSDAKTVEKMVDDIHDQLQVAADDILTIDCDDISGVNWKS